ncbi:Hint domain-containing protein [Pseudomonas benzopyrenica]|uniref:Hint domain-containing protein n=1 Tax=Pseudomonas benzopyrenica TaxID=2993566 RepID=UPI003F1367F7
MEKQCLNGTVMGGTVETQAEAIAGATPLGNALSIKLLMPQNKATLAAVTAPGVIRIGRKGEVKIGDEVVFTASTKKSMSLAQAVVWYREQATAIAKVLARSDLPADLQMLQAYKLREAQQQGAMNALIEPGIAEEFASRFRLEPLQKMVQESINDLKLSGKALFDAIAAKLSKVDEDIRYPSQAGGCFIKGTRVYTKDGKKPIEEIQVGDWVLSSPEDGSGQPECKRVVRTFAHDPQLIFRIIIHPEGWIFPDASYSVVATGNHPFCIGWTRADGLKPQQRLRQGDGGRAFVGDVSWVYRTGQEGIGWVSSTPGPDGHGSVFDYANYSAVDDSVEEKFLYLPSEVLASDEPYLRVPVFNFEVEDFHTYYVGGKQGFWVRGSN